MSGSAALSVSGSVSVQTNIMYFIAVPHSRELTTMTNERPESGQRGRRSAGGGASRVQRVIIAYEAGLVPPPR
ncbi:hypothetical protein GCM10020219_083420 [Nonomuraea dietziae]